MGSYGDAALLATDLAASGKVRSPTEAWSKAVQTEFQNSASLQKKGCPKGAFLGLCEEEFITGIPPGAYTRSIKNKRYAIDACHLLRQDPSLAADPNRLWTSVLYGTRKVHNQQMDVVLALWNAGLVVPASSQQSVGGDAGQGER